VTSRKQLVVGHLEDVSWKVLADYRDVVADLIRRRSGVYALFRRENLYYVGLASNLMGRLDGHVRDRHHGKWDRFSVYLTVHADHMKELESLLLRITAPEGNKTGGRFAKSQNLRSTLHRGMKEADFDKHAALLGGPVALRRSRSRARRAKGSLALTGLVQRATQLRAYRGDWEYRGSLRRDGRIRYGKRVFDSPNAAGRAAVRGRCNGWNFWHLKNRRGQWVPLRSFRS